ncbi:peptidoglycan recognition protein [Streptomyces sp. NPDC059477]|uniref:peptidoglycan recognition protein family protein n=1 Tax=Streptomyces sp. NPDC059477 TaxID=3346847 RepID=UPI0036B3725A
MCATSRRNPVPGVVRRSRAVLRRSLRRSLGAVRRYRERAPRAVLIALGCVPGIAAVTVLGLCAAGVERGRTGHGSVPEGARPPAYDAPRPRIVPRSAWLDPDDTRKRPAPRYDDRVVAVFVHHTDSPNAYDCAEAPQIIRSLAAGQTGARDWDDIGYNFLVDRCGTLYEGRAGGVDKPVTGAHTQGFNHRTAGIAAIGTFTAGAEVPKAMTDAIAALTAWKLGLAGTDPRERVRLVSSNSLSRFRSGTPVMLPTVSGHNDGYMTTCPGAALTALLPEIKERAARLQGRAPTPGSAIPGAGIRTGEGVTPGPVVTPGPGATPGTGTGTGAPTGVATGAATGVTP